MKVRISPRARGPLVVEGDIDLVDLDGRPVETAGRQRVLLCRCGATRVRPLCDGSHNRTGFEAPPPAEPEVE
ncbi:MAG: CDGSH iron-sulfur domain-containing protein [Deltaproteobacteria bacterium]|nr:CDGSH iron-sulfur domain-containing protein [Deltaproteobacteria bacterium]